MAVPLSAVDLPDFTDLGTFSYNNDFSSSTEGYGIVGVSKNLTYVLSYTLHISSKSC